MAAADFLKAWGTADAKPQAAYRVPAAAEVDWTLSTRPHESQSAADQTLTLKFAADHVNLTFEAELLTVSGYLFQYRLTAPEGLKVDAVSLLEEGFERAARWSQDSDGTITIFLSGPVSGRQRLTLRGQAPLGMGEEWFVPPMHIEKVEIRSAVIRLFRHPEVLLSIRGARQGVGEEPAGDDAAADRTRFVEAFSWDGVHSPWVAVTAQPNGPKVRAQQTVRPDWNGRSWNLKTELEISVRDGLLDEICIHAPDAWTGPYEASPPGQLDIHETPGGQRQLVYRPQTAISDSFLLSIEGPLEVSRGERLRVPDVVLLHAGELQRWFILPNRSQDRQMRWQTQGMKPSPWPTDVAGAADPKATAYEVSGEPVQAVLAPAETPPSKSQVRLADIVLAWRNDGSYCGTAAFDIEPGGSVCPLHLPPGCEPVHVSVEGVPVTPQAVGNADWRLPLSSERLPQRVEVLFRGTMSPGDRAGRRIFAAPTLGDLPVEQTVWTVIGPPSWRADQPQSVAITSWQRDLLRLKSAAVAMESAYAMSSDDSDETPQWFRSWARRLIVSRDALRRDLAAIAADKEVGAAKQEIDRLDRRTVEIAKNLNATEVLTQISAAPPSADGADEILERSAEAARSAVRCSFQGRTDSLAIDYRQTENGEFSSRLAAAAVFAVLFVLGSFGAVRGRAAAMLCRWPHAGVAVLGLAWWLWLSPSVLGLAIVLAAAIAAAYSALAFDAKSRQKSRA